jgi:hypothetical protein
VDRTLKLSPEDEEHDGCSKDEQVKERDISRFIGGGSALEKSQSSAKKGDIRDADRPEKDLPGVLARDDRRDAADQQE